MSSPAPNPAHTGISAYALYGEAEGASVPSGVHVETIRARSSPLGWRIAAHRHAGLAQGLLVAEGGARATIEGTAAELGPGSLAFVPPLVVHGYAFAPDTAGIVVSIPIPLLRRGLADAPQVLARLDRPMLLADFSRTRPAAFGEARALFEALLAEHGGFAPGRGAALNARAALLALWFAREAGPAEAPAAARPELAGVGRFLAEVEASYADARPLGDYARSVGLSVPHLARLCRAVTGRSPLGLVHDRRLIEAKRLLVYTASPVSEIARRLGFCSAGYFSRFFRARTGLSPRLFRERAEGR